MGVQSDSLKDLKKPGPSPSIVAVSPMSVAPPVVPDVQQVDRAADEERKRTDAAEKIQAGFAGLKDRRRVTKMKESISVVEQDADPALESLKVEDIQLQSAPNRQ